MFAARDPSDVDRFFRGLTEYAFHARLGIVDPPLVDYVALLLVRFLRHDALVTPSCGEGAADVTTLLVAAGDHAPEEALAEYRHVGDYTLFWSGLYPEAVERLCMPGRADRFVDFRVAGKRAYWLASTLEPDHAAQERLLFERLSHDYDLCVEGLGEVRRAWGDAA
ncbi:MAG: hypothetical protein EBR28_10605 [Planctomycetia bacterium]|nr:hypothetical protein [Planctomycetia bacterium]